jgi:hypothetical protein
MVFNDIVCNCNLTLTDTLWLNLTEGLFMGHTERVQAHFFHQHLEVVPRGLDSRQGVCCLQAGGLYCNMLEVFS